MGFFIAVHIGCGSHSSNADIVKQYLSLLRECCVLGAQELLKKKGTKSQISSNSSPSLPCVECIKTAISTLEDHPRTNSGNGSNLTWDGKVETDATLACFLNNNSEETDPSSVKNQSCSSAEENENENNSQIFARKFHGSVGACPGVKNPIKLCSQILKDQLFGSPLPLGLVKPCFLCGDQAYRYAAQVFWKNRKPQQSSYPIEVFEPNLLINEDPMKNTDFLMTTESKSKWKFYKDAVLQKISSKNMKNEKKPEKSDDTFLYDTVGAICVDDDGNLAVGCSSGGLLLKCSGRVGQSAILGSGCDVSENFAVCCTGSGETIMNVQLAKEILTKISNNQKEKQEVFQKNEEGTSENEENEETSENEEDEEISQKIKSIFEKFGFGKNSRECGCICVKKQQNNRFEFGFGFTTKSMGIGYFSSNMKKPHAEIHRKEEKDVSYVGSEFV